MSVQSARNSTAQQLAYTGSSSSASTAFGAQTRQIRIVATSACHYAIGSAITAAATTDPFLPANWIEYVTVNPGEKIAAIRAGTDGLITATSGTLHVAELT